MSSEKVEPGLVIAGRYRVERQLGAGGMGSVFLVQHVHTDELLALKVLHEAVVGDAVALERFKREARTPARISSDYVVRVTDADVAPELDGAPFLVMEYLRGKDLDRILTERGPLPAEEVIRYLKQAARALDKAHAMGIVHRDLKPENLFLSEREDGSPLVKVLDFGIAKLTEGAGVGTKTGTGQIFGTPMFMSPEQALAEHAKVSPQTDVWALGLIAHKLLTGNNFWTATTLTHLIAQIAYQQMPVPSARGVPFGPQYDAWFARCCAREAAARYASAGEAVAELERTLGVAPEMSLPPPASGPGRASGNGGEIRAKAIPANSAPLGLTAEPLMISAAPLRRRAGLGAVAVIAMIAGVAAGMWLLRPLHKRHDVGGSSAASMPTELPAEAAREPAAGGLALSAQPTVSPMGAATAEPAAADAGADAASAVDAVRRSTAVTAPTEPPRATKPRGGAKPPPSATAAAPAAPVSAPPRDPLQGRH